MSKKINKKKERKSRCKADPRHCSSYNWHYGPKVQHKQGVRQPWTAWIFLQSYQYLLWRILICLKSYYWSSGAGMARCTSMRTKFKSPAPKWKVQHGWMCTTATSALWRPQTGGPLRAPAHQPSSRWAPQESNDAGDGVGHPTSWCVYKGARPPAYTLHTHTWTQKRKECLHIWSRLALYRHPEKENKKLYQNSNALLSIVTPGGTITTRNPGEHQNVFTLRDKIQFGRLGWQCNSFICKAILYLQWGVR